MPKAKRVGEAVLKVEKVIKKLKNVRKFAKSWLNAEKVSLLYRNAIGIFKICEWKKAKWGGGGKSGSKGLLCRSPKTTTAVHLQYKCLV